MAERAEIVVVEPDALAGRFLADQLGVDGFVASLTGDAAAALARAAVASARLMLIGDLEPRREALELIAVVRAGYAGGPDPRLPIVALSADRSERAVLEAFEAGADDVVARPFSYPELRARIVALLRRCGERPRGATLRIGPLEIDGARRLVCVAGRTVCLCPLEYRLLAHLAADPERVFSKQELLGELWQQRCPSLTRTLENTAGRLRRKLGCGLVVTVWGVGYRLVEPSGPTRAIEP